MYSRFSWSQRALGGLTLAGLAALAACAPKPAPPPPPPPPPVVVVPPKPTPPDGAQDQMTIPPKTDTGERHTVNYGISTVQAVWNFRSAYNVAALNCLEPRYAPILAGYKRFLTVYDAALDRANKEIDRSFRVGHTRREAIIAREKYQTQVYNYFALPPVGNSFCDAAMGVTTDLETVAPDQFEPWSFVGLSKLEQPFKDFFDAYEKYRSELAAWEQMYGGGLVTVRPNEEQKEAREKETF